MSKNNGFDLSAFDGLQAAQEEGVPVDILHPATGESMGVTIVVAGPDSTHAKKAERLMINRRLRSRKTSVMDAGELQEEGLKKLAAMTLSWTGIVDSGKAVECTPENALKVFARAPFIAEQVAEAAGDRAAFFPT